MSGLLSMPAPKNPCVVHIAIEWCLQMREAHSSHDGEPISAASRDRTSKGALQTWCTNALQLTDVPGVQPLQQSWRARGAVNSDPVVSGGRVRVARPSCSGSQKAGDGARNGASTQQIAVHYVPRHAQRGYVRRLCGGTLARARHNLAGVAPSWVHCAALLAVLVLVAGAVMAAVSWYVYHQSGSDADLFNSFAAALAMCDAVRWPVLAVQIAAVWPVGASVLLAYSMMLLYLAATLSATVVLAALWGACEARSAWGPRCAAFEHDAHCDASQRALSSAAACSPTAERGPRTEAGNASGHGGGERAWPLGLLLRALQGAWASPGFTLRLSGESWEFTTPATLLRRRRAARGSPQGLQGAQVCRAGFGGVPALPSQAERERSTHAPACPCFVRLVSQCCPSLAVCAETRCAVLSCLPAVPSNTSLCDHVITETV